MGDRGNCKFFAPNYFNPTKCQNCFKQKDQHSAQELAGADGNAGGSKALAGNRNVGPPKKLLKESVLLKATIGRENGTPETWFQRWFALYSNGELQEYAIDDGQVNKDNMMSSVMLQDFIRMLDGKVELNEKLCFGVKTLRETIYFKTTTKVDYENWWKEVSSFVASPLKRTTSASVTTGVKPPSLGMLPSRSLCKQLSVPLSTISPSRSSRSSSTASLQSELEDPQTEELRKQVSKLEDENSKLRKDDKQRRELELEVDYWKKYVTSQNLSKQSGGSSDTVTELAESRRSLIQLQDELNQTQKKLKTNMGKLLIKNKELADFKEKLREANSITAVYKAKIDQLTKEKNRTEDDLDPSTVDSDGNRLDPWQSENDYFDSGVSGSPASSDAQHLEDKFLLLKDKLKRIERELLIKSKELEKANDSRSKVAKYTRSLLQELETRLRDNQQKLNETQEKLKNTTVELNMERERRIKLEENPRRRMSNVVPSPKAFNVESYTSGTTPAPQTSASAIDLSELNDVDTKYADYYRSRFKEAESSLLEKDMKLHQAEEKIKEIQESMKSNNDAYKVINEMQVKLSDATHKLSDRQLKIHELTCEVDRLKKFEKTYGKKRQQCGALEDIVKDLESKNTELRKSMHGVKQELEIVRIREVVLKEQLQTFADDSEDEEEEEDGIDNKLDRSIDLKRKIECMVDLESKCKKLEIDNESLLKKNTEFETRVRHLNMVNFKNLESTKEPLPGGENKPDINTEKRVKELEHHLSTEEEKFCNQLSCMKEQYQNDISVMEKNSQAEIAKAKEELSQAKLEIEKLSSSKSEMETKIEELQIRVSTYEKETKPSSSTSTSASSSRQRRIEREPIVDEDEPEAQSSSAGVVVSDEKKRVDKNDPYKPECDQKVGSSVDKKDTATYGVKDRDSGIVITQEIKSMIDAAKNKNVEIFTSDTDELFSIPHDTVISEIDIIEKYKTMCGKFQVKLKELGMKYVHSEEKCIQLAQTLDQFTTQNKEGSPSEKAFVEEYNILLARIEDLETQIGDSQELLQSKADELEKERKNVIHLVEVTSAYIKELEGSLEESKAKLSTAQRGYESSPEKSANDSTNTENDDHIDGEEAAAIRQKLTARIMTLQSDISELTEKHATEMEQIKSESTEELEVLRRQLGSVEVNPDVEALRAEIKNLEDALKNQNHNYALEVEELNQHFQAELKQAFSGDGNAGIDMLNRMQELEVELEETRKSYDARIRETQENHEKEMKEMKEDMAYALQAHMSGSFSGALTDEGMNSTVEELEEKIVRLEQEISDKEQKYLEDLELEKKAHQAEMEDTIRDMMMVQNLTKSYDAPPEDGAPSPPLSGDAASVSSEEFNALKLAHEKELEQLKADHENEVALVRSDFTLVIQSLRQGSSSDTIVELHSKINESGDEIGKLKEKHDEEVEALNTKLKRSESQNFYATRRQEEMGMKIFNLQNQHDEMEEKYQMEIKSYQDRLSYLTGNHDNDEDVNSCMNEVTMLREKTKNLESELEELRNEQDQKSESIVMKMQEEKRREIEEMTDKVLKLESLIDEMKESHIRDLNAYEQCDREEKSEARVAEQERLKDLEIINKALKVDYEKEIDELATEHKKEVEKLRVFYEKEISDMKKKLSGEDNRRASHENLQSVKQAVKEQKELHEKEVSSLKAKFASEKDSTEKQHQKDIDDIRQQYDEKLKMNYKEGLRRQSTSDRKSDGARMRQLISEKDNLETKLLELEIKYDKEIEEKGERIKELEKCVELAKTNPDASETQRALHNTQPNLDNNGDSVDNEMQKKIKEIQEQIDRYHRRIAYYHDKAARDNTEESPRVAELQSQIVDLQKEMEDLNRGTNPLQRSVSEQVSSPYEKDEASKLNARRSTSDSAPSRRHTDSVTVKVGRRRESDPRKRWSTLEESSEKEQNKARSVLARKTLWENISTDDPKYTG